MIIEPMTRDHIVRELTYSREAGNIRLRWRYKEASDFLVFIYDGRQKFDLEAVCAQLADAGYDDAQLTGQTKRFQPAGADARCRLAYIRKAEFQREGRSFSFPARELKKDRPYGIRVYACVMEDGLRVFPAEAEYNTCYFPVKIRADIRYHTKPFSKEKYCVLRLPQMEDYADGSLRYHVEGASCDIPLPQSCLGRELTIRIPKKSGVSIRVQEAYKKYYSIAHLK